MVLLEQYFENPLILYVIWGTGHFSVSPGSPEIRNPPLDPILINEIHDIRILLLLLELLICRPLTLSPRVLFHLDYFMINLSFQKSMFKLYFIIKYEVLTINEALELT